MYRTVLKYSAILSIIVGVLHVTLVAIGHLEHIPLETIFFILIGIAQILFGVEVLQDKKKGEVKNLFLVNAGIIFVWLYTRILRAPFTSSAEEISTFGFTIFILEVVVIVGLSFSYRHYSNTETKKSSKELMLLFLISFLFGTVVYLSGMLGEVVMPNRTISHSHGHSEAKDEHDDEIMDDHYGDEKTEVETDKPSESMKDEMNEHMRDGAEKGADDHGSIESLPHGHN